MKKILQLFVVLLLLLIPIGNINTYATATPTPTLPPTDIGPTRTPTPPMHTPTPPPRTPPPTPPPTPTPTANVFVTNAEKIRNATITINNATHEIVSDDESIINIRIGQHDITIEGDNIVTHTERINIIRDSNGNHIIDLSYMGLTYLVELRIFEVAHLQEGRVALFNEFGDYIVDIELDGSSIYTAFIEAGLYRITVNGEDIVYQNNMPPSWMVTAVEGESSLNVSLMSIQSYSALALIATPPPPPPPTPTPPPSPH